MKKSKSQGRTALQEEVTNIAMIRKNLPFTDDAPQHFKQPDRSLHPAIAFVAND